MTQLDSSGTSGGTALDQAAFSYDGWGNIASYRQDVDSAFGGSGDDEYEVSYTWEKATSGRASLRRTGITLPSGASVGLDYRKRPAALQGPSRGAIGSEATPMWATTSRGSGSSCRIGSGA